MRTRLEVAGHAHPEPDVWILYFNWEKNPLPMNGTGSRGAHWAKTARQTRWVRTRSEYIARLAKIPPLGRCRVLLTWWVALDRVRDPDNLGQLEKRLFDGLVDAGVVVDDKPELMTKDRAVIRKVADSEGIVTEPCFTLRIERIGADG